MKYYKDTEGNLYADPASTDGLEEVLSPVRADGSILPQHEAIDLVALQEDGTRYSHYQSEPDEDVVYQPDVEAIQKVADDEEAEVLKKEQSALKLEGVLFNGTMCSATAEDMWGLTAIAIGIDKLGMDYSFKFDNGNTLIINPDNYSDFMDVWAPFRNSFF